MCGASSVFFTFMLNFPSWTSFSRSRKKRGQGDVGIWRIAGLNVRRTSLFTPWKQDVCWLYQSLYDTRAVTLSCHGENKPADSVAELALTTLVCKRREDHMAALLCRSWVVPQDECSCLYFSPTIAKPGVNPHSHMTANRKRGIGSKCNNNMASPKFMPTGHLSSLYGGSILSTSAWYEDGAAAGLNLGAGRLPAVSSFCN